MDTAGIEGRNNERDNQFSSGGGGLQSFITRKQPRHSVLDIGSGDNNDNKLNNVVHNIYIDHIDKHDDSGFHHHHRTGNLNDHNIIYHKHDGGDIHDHDHSIIHYDHDGGGDFDYDLYGAADHDHAAVVYDRRTDIYDTTNVNVIDAPEHRH